MSGRAHPSNPRALAGLVSRESELAFLLRCLIKRSPRPPPKGQLAFTVIGCGWALFGNRAAGKRPREGQSVCKTPSKTTITNHGGLKNFDTPRDGGQEGEIVLRVWGSAVAPEGVLHHVHPLGDSPRRSGARVPKVLPSAEIKGILTGLIVAVPLEPSGGAAVGNDVEKPQELAVEPPAGGDDAGKEGGVAGPVACHLGVSCALQEAAWLRITERPILDDVGEVIAEFVVDCTSRTRWR